MQHPFLSDEWIEAARAIRAEYQDQVPTPEASVKMNLIVTEVPFESGDTIEAHVDTSGGQVAVDSGHLDAADVTVTVDYDTAKDLFVGQNPEAAMTAFMAGKILVQGDLTALMALMAQPPDTESMQLAQQIATRTAAITSD